MTLQHGQPESGAEESAGNVPTLPLEIIEQFVSAFIDSVTDDDHKSLVAAISETRSFGGPWHRQLTMAQTTTLSLLHTSRYVRRLITQHLVAHVTSTKPLIVETTDKRAMPFLVDARDKVEHGVTAALRWYMLNATQTTIEPLVMPGSNDDILILGKQEIFGINVYVHTDGSTFNSHRGRQFGWTTLAREWRHDEPYAPLTTRQVYEVIRKAFSNAPSHARCVNPYHRILVWAENKPLIDVAVMVQLYGKTLMPDPFVWTVRQADYGIHHYEEGGRYDEDADVDDEDYEWYDGYDEEEEEAYYDH